MQSMMQGAGAGAGAMMRGQPYTSSFSLSELGAIMDKKMFGEVCVTCFEKSKLLLEHRRGYHQQTRLHLEKGQTLMKIVCSDPPDRTISFYSLDGSHPEDWEHYRSMLTKPESRRKMDSLTKALELCGEAAKIDASDPRRTALVDKAIDISPDLCAKAYFMKFELLSRRMTMDPFANTTGLDKEHTPTSELCVRALKNGVSAGRNFVKLINTSQICGNLYTNLPTRWYVRCLYLLGSLLFFLGDLDGADMYLKECLAVDIHDKLGARNKQLLVSLERKEGIGGSEIPYLLKARFTEDQMEDNVTALWNYTRALHAFAKKGDTKTSKKLLAHAINKNPFVPPQLLAWESVTSGEMFMVIGKENEAGDYTTDNAKHWVGVKGALKWLEQTYCRLKNVSPLTTDDECMQLLVAGTRLEQQPGGAQQGKESFQRLLEILDALPASNSGNPKLRSIVHQRLGHCYNQLNQYDDALRNYNSAMCLCDPGDKNAIKELFYNRAQCKENQGDLNGSLEDFTFVWERIGKFSCAVEGIQKIEAKLNVQTSVLPPSRSIGGVTESDDVVRRRVDDIARSMPRVDTRKTVAATVARCDHCRRGGVALAKCSGCSESQFCSKECLVASWKAVHKYVCKTSKHRLEMGAKVRVRGLEKAPQHNGKVATIDRFLPDKSRFSIKMESKEDGQSPVMLSVRPQNLEKVVE
jgi:tetratricopeptide (TPR) repeat protein